MQIFWQKFYRNFTWVVLYQIYHFCRILWIWLVTITNGRLNLQKILKNHLRSHKGKEAKTAEMFITLASTKIMHLLPLLMYFRCYGNLKVSIYLQWEKWKLAFIAISLQLFWQKFFRNVYWVVLYQTYYFGSNLWVFISTKRLNLPKILKNHLLRSSIMGKAETLQKCSEH